MTPGIYQWDELDELEGNALLVVNSGRHAETEVDAVLTMLQAHLSPTALYVIAPERWGDWLTSRGIPPERRLSTTAPDGAEFEINHALQTSTALLWAVPKQFRYVIGSAPHSMYNERVQAPFEARACLLLGEGTFLAHALPSDYVYALDAADLLERADRDRAVASYQRATASLVSRLHAQWLAQGRPEGDLATGPDAFDAALAELPPQVANFDEDRPPPLSVGDASGAARVVMDLGRRLFERDLRMQDYLDAVHDRDVLVVEYARLLAELEAARAERVEAVNIRDAIIDELRAQTETLPRKVWRRLKGEFA